MLNIENNVENYVAHITKDGYSARGPPYKKIKHVKQYLKNDVLILNNFTYPAGQGRFAELCKMLFCKNQKR